MYIILAYSKCAFVNSFGLRAFAIVRAGGGGRQIGGSSPQCAISRAVSRG